MKPVATAIADVQKRQLAEFDAAPVTDARIWDQVRDAIEGRLEDYFGSTVSRAYANELTTIALGERQEP